MRTSLFLNTTMSKTCAQSRRKDWLLQGRKKHSLPAHGTTRPFPYEAGGSGGKAKATSVGSVRQLPDFLSACYHLQWFISRNTVAQALHTAVAQIQSLSALLLFYLTAVVLCAQVAGVAILLSCAVSLPLGFQFLVGSVLFIAATAFKIMQ